MHRIVLLVAALASLIACSAAAADSHDWLRYGRDDQLTNDAPAILATRLSADTARRLSPIWSVQLDGGIVASPLYVRGLAVGKTRQDVVFAATEGGSVYALVRKTGEILWHRELGSTVVCQEDTPGFVYGISSTPVIDRPSNTMYVIGASGILHALDLATGAERGGGWPLELLSLTDVNYVWGGLTLANGRLYVPVASYCDQADPLGHIADGRLISVDVAAPHVIATFDVVPGPENLGGVWGYGGSSIDPLDGSIWTATGNSWVFDPDCGCIQEGVGYAESVVKLNPDLTVLASNRPPGLPSPIVEDTDFGGTPLLFQPAGCPAMAAAHAKNGMLYVWNRATLDSGPIWSVRIGPDDLEHPFIGEPSWSAELQTLFVANARIYSPVGVVRFDAAVAFRMGAGCRFPDDPTWIADAGIGTKPPPLVVGNVVFVPGGEAYALYGLDARDGRVLWIGALDGPDFSSPIVADGAIVVGDMTGRMTAFEVDGGCVDVWVRGFHGEQWC